MGSSHCQQSLALLAAASLICLGGAAHSDPDFVCPTSDGLFANPSDCRRFFMCAGYHPFSQACPPSLYFDDVKKFCTRKTKELMCGPVETTTSGPTTPDPLTADPCDSSRCQLPDCYCSPDGTRIPGDLDPHETPQMILLSFDGALNTLNFEHYRAVLNSSRVNPDGCPIRATFFTSHQYSSYYMVQKLFAAGHEIAIHSISHRGPESWWARAGYQNWAEEMVGMREILHRFTNISREQLLGVRAPYLKPGGNDMASVAFDYGFVYDSSLAVSRQAVPAWPYTLDYRAPHRCVSGTCPTQTFPGLWEIPLNTLYSSDGTGGNCILADQCVFDPDSEIVYDFLMENFHRHYESNRAPLGLFFHVNWFNEKYKVKALHRFMDDLLKNYKDVWFVTMSQAIAWMKSPRPSSSVANLADWACPKRRPSCNLPTTCELPFQGGVRYFETCMTCPARYPWVGNFLGSEQDASVSDLSSSS